MGIENILISRQEQLAKALAVTKFSVKSKQFVLDETDVRLLLNRFGRNTMRDVMSTLKPVEIEGGSKLEFPRQLS